jgi:hypothetical protein
MKMNKHMLISRQRLCVVGVMLASLQGCSPVLNWREIQLDRLVVFLPCKPDRAARDVEIAGKGVSIEMAGCEADGALFAASHIRTGDAAQAQALLQSWQAATFANMRADKPIAIPPDGQPELPSVHHWSASGTRANGEPVQARLSWWVSGADVFHVAVYAGRLRNEHTETLFSQAKIQ